jgi:hypothetical protein
MAPQKPVTLLKRQHATPQQAAPASAPHASTVLPDRVADAIRGIVDGALTRERARVHAVYAARQDALLKVLSDILRDGLRAEVAAAAEREAGALAAAVWTMSANDDAAAAGGGGGTPAVANGGGDELAAVRASFQKAFETELLGAIEGALGGMMATVSAAVDAGVEAEVAAPAADDAARALRSAADQVRSDTAHFSAIARVHDDARRKRRANGRGGGGRGGDDDIEVAKPVNREDAVLSEVVRALNDGRVRDAMELSLDHSAVVRAKALNGALDSGVAPEEVIGAAEGSAVLPINAYTSLIALLASDLGDRTATRLAWLMEATMNLEDAPRRNGAASDPDVKSDVRHLESAVEKLKEMHVDRDATPADVKQAKLLVRCLQVTVHSLKR